MRRHVQQCLRVLSLSSTNSTGYIGQKPVMHMRQTSVCSISDKTSHVVHSNILIHRGVTGHGSERELMTASERQTDLPTVFTAVKLLE